MKIIKIVIILKAWFVPLFFSPNYQFWIEFKNPQLSLSYANIFRQRHLFEVQWNNIWVQLKSTILVHCARDICACFFSVLAIVQLIFIFCANFISKVHQWMQSIGIIFILKRYLWINSNYFTFATVNITGENRWSFEFVTNISMFFMEICNKLWDSMNFFVES